MMADDYKTHEHDEEEHEAKAMLPSDSEWRSTRGRAKYWPGWDGDKVVSDDIEEDSEKQLKDNGSTTSDKPTEINSVKRDGRNSQYSRDLKIQKKNEQNSRIKVMKTVSIYLCEVGLGLAASFGGPTLPNMQELLSVTTAQVTVGYFTNGVGYLLGSLLLGLLYDRLNRELQLLVTSIACGLFTALTPWVNSLYAYLTFMSLQGLTMGFIDAASQPYCLDIWEDSTKKEPVLVGLHSTWSAGSVIAPVIISLFLTEPHSYKYIKHNDTINGHDYVAVNSSTSTDDVNFTFQYYSNATFHSPPSTAFISNSTMLVPTGNVGLVRYGFLAIGILIALTSIGFIILFIREPSFYLCEKIDSDNDSTTESRPAIMTKVAIRFMCGGLVIFFTFFQWAEDIPANLLATFVTGHLNWTVESGSYITSLFWLTQGIGCVIGIPLSAYLSPRTMVLVNLILGCVSWLILMVENTPPVLVWVSAALAGFGVSTATASATLWCSSYVRISGVIAGLLTAGTAIGSMTGSTLTGYLMDNYTLVAMVYICLVTTAFVMVTFLLLLAYVKCVSNVEPRNAVPSIHVANPEI